MERRTYTRREVVKGGAAALLGASLALPLASRRAGALTRGVSVGIFPSGNGPLYGDFAELDAYINLAGGVVPKLVSVFSAWVPEGSTSYLHPNTDDLMLFYNRYPGSLLVWTWEPFGVTLQQINSGAHDAYIDEVARRIGAVGKRVLIRFAHEMNGNWSWPWLNQPPADYIAAWKRIVSRFRSLGVTNVEWVWSPNTVTVGGSAKDFTPWYPGDAYVDWTALDGYNWGTVHTGWRTFRESFEYSTGLITALSPRGLIIAETGCHSRGPNGESKGDWFRQMAAELKQNFPRLLGLIYSHMIHQRNGEDAEWRVDMPITALDDWQSLVADPQFQAPLGPVITASVDTAAPKVTAVAPQNGATGVNPSTNVSATFSEAMTASTINATTFKLFRLNADGTTSRVAAAVTYSPTSKMAVLNPNNNLSLGRKYKATIGTGATDPAGNALDQDPTKTGNQGKTWTFTVRRT
jgi:Bacterial Ig-like domain/Glycosyl hydrolase family 26